MTILKNIDQNIEIGLSLNVKLFWLYFVKNITYKTCKTCKTSIYSVRNGRLLFFVANTCPYNPL